MNEIFDSVIGLIGKTPMLRASRYTEKRDVRDVELLVKLEYLNPTGSVKDRAAYAMIEAAERDGRLKPGGTVIILPGFSDAFSAFNLQISQQFALVILFHHTEIRVVILAIIINQIMAVSTHPLHHNTTFGKNCLSSFRINNNVGMINPKII